MGEFQSTRPMRGGAATGSPPARSSWYFNPPSLCREGPHCEARCACTVYISIHPPRVGRDWRDTMEGRTFGNFNPPAPCGAGHALSATSENPVQFQSTRPVRGGTRNPSTFRIFSHISIHPPRARRDSAASDRPVSQYIFQSTRPVWGGTL